MEVKRLHNDQLDKVKWDETIQNSSFPCIYALSWYLDQVAPNWDALVLGDYQYVFPLTVKKKFSVIKYIGSPNFCQQLGLFSREPIDEKKLLQIIAAIPSTYLRKDIPLNHINPINGGTQQRANFVLHASPITEIRANYSSQTKRNLKKALKNDLKVVSDVDFRNVISLFQNTKGQTIEKVDYSILELLCTQASEKGILHTFGVYTNETLISGALFFEFNKRWYMILLASSTKGKELLASTLMIDVVIEKATSREFTIDFEGSSIASLARFYKGFGGINEGYQLYSSRII
jgi:hypothetical protein